MNADEINKKLAELGLKSGAWTQAGGRTVSSPMLEQQKKVLAQVKELLEQQVQADRQTVEELRERVERIKHGGAV